MKFLLGSLMFLSACFLSNGIYTPEPRAGDKDSKLITKVWENVNPEKWRRSPWYHFDTDMTIPSNVIESGEYACILDFPDINQPTKNHYYICKSGWRSAQRRG